MAPKSGETRTSGLTCIVLAGGSGTRFGQDIPKQFARLAGAPVLHRTLAVLESHPDILEVVVVANPDWISQTEAVCEKAIVETTWRVVPGGATRNLSTIAGLSAIPVPDGKVLIHDAVRPFLSHEIIDRCAQALDHADAADTVVPTGDTIVQVEDDRVVVIPDRSRLRRGQTPQAFWLADIRAAYERAESEGFTDAPDDCSVLLWARPDAVIAAVHGHDRNIKITTATDLDVADRLLQSEGVEIDLAPHDAVLVGRRIAVIGGSSGIGQALVHEIEAHGGEAIPASPSVNGLDIRDPRSVNDFLRSSSTEAPITDVVLTSGKLLVKPLAECPPNEIDELVDVNLRGVITVAQASFDALREARGSLLLFTSSSFTRGRANYAVYSATKAAVVNLCQALAEEWADDGVRVNVMSPGRTETPMRTRAFGNEDPGTLIPAGNVASAAIRALVSPLTGQVFHVRHTGGTW
jgi:2-C-methyl-D-erythritol 4-phosphate cytidylyltransferase